MMDSLFLAGFDPLHETPESCVLCSLRPPVFAFDYRALDKNQRTRETKGFCCALCAVALVRKLQRAEAQEWASEEAALAADNVDVTELHRHRVTVFPGRHRKAEG